MFFLCFGELYVCGIKFAYVFVYSFVCSACCVFDGVGELFLECVCYLLVCGGCFVAEGDSVVSLGISFVSYPNYDSPLYVRVLFVIPSSV